MNKEEFGALIRKEREAKGLSVLELSSALRINKQDLYAIEYGKRNVSKDKKAKMLEFFNIEYKEVAIISKKTEK